MRHLYCAVLGAVLVGTGALAETAWLNAAAKLELEEPAVRLEPGLFSMSWNHRTSKFDANAATPEIGKPFAFTIDIPDDGGVMRGVATFTPLPQGAVRCRYEFTPERDVKLNMLGVTCGMQADWLTERAWKTDLEAGIFPAKLQGAMVYYARPTKWLELAFANGPLRFELAEGMTLLLQDDRQWGGNSFSLRIGFNGNPNAFAAGQMYAVEFTVSAAAGLDVKADGAVVLQAGAEWEPLPLLLEIEPDSALDFSKLGWIDAPAGKHGYVVAKGPHFEFEKMPGKSQRFYGVNFCFGANAIDPALSERVAERLMRLGYNSVRIHHYEGELTRGSADSVTLNPEAMAKFDALAAALIKRGLYLTTDLFVSRSVPWKEIGEDQPGNVPMDLFKSFIYVHPGAKENQKKFIDNFLTHVNPHTGRSYAEEPALPWIVMINEGNHFNFPGQFERPEWRAAWTRWITKKRAEDAAFAEIPDSLPENFWGTGKHLSAFQIFIADVEIDFMNEWKAYLRDTLKCRALFSNQNGWTHRVSDQRSRAATYDYVDDHFYIDHPHFLDRPWQLPSSCPNVNPIRSGHIGGYNCAFLRLLDKPFTISEFNYSAPGMYRGIGGILTGALAAQQDWSALWRFAYSHTANMGEPMRLGYFDMISDPLGQAAERASMCIFMRGDIAPHAETAAVDFSNQDLTQPRDGAFPSSNLSHWRPVVEQCKVGANVGAGNGTPFEKDFGGFTPQPASEPARAIALNAPVPGAMTLNTARTCGGFIEKGALQAGAIRFDVGDVPATVWVSSLDNTPVAQSRRLLLSHLTDVQDSDMKYGNRGRNILLDWGRLPHLVRVGQAKIELTLDAPEQCAVYALSTAGNRLNRIPVVIKDGRLTFTADSSNRRTFEPRDTELPRGAVMLYEIIRE